MEAKGAKCDDISSLKVYGIYCQTTVYEFGDFNQQHKGWQATFGPGFFARDQLVKGGAKDNDISSMKVIRTGAASNTSNNPFGAQPFGNGSIPFNGTNPFLGSNPFNASHGGWNPFNASHGGWNPFSGSSSVALSVLCTVVIFLSQ
jgi:hypothetical protein